MKPKKSNFFYWVTQLAEVNFVVPARAPIGSVRFRFKPNRYRTDWIGIGIGIYRNFGFGFYRLPIPISKIPKPKPKYRNLKSVILKIEHRKLSQHPEIVEECAAAH